MYKELLIFPESMRETVIFPDVARRLVAEASNSFPIDPLVFNRQQDGKTVQGKDEDGLGLPPLISFGGGKGVIRVTGLGPDGVALLEAEAPKLVSAVGMHLQSVFTFRTNSGECQIEGTYPVLYRIKQLVLAKKPRLIDVHKDSNGKFTLESVKPLATKAIIDGILSQARFLDERCPVSPSRESMIGTDDMLSINLLAGTPFLADIKNGERVFALVMRNLEFSMDLCLNGPWLVGKLRSRGYGLIQRKVF